MTFIFIWSSTRCDNKMQKLKPGKIINKQNTKKDIPLLYLLWCGWINPWLIKQINSPLDDFQTKAMSLDVFFPTNYTTWSTIPNILESINMFL